MKSRNNDLPEEKMAIEDRNKKTVLSKSFCPKERQTIEYAPVVFRRTPLVKKDGMLFFSPPTEAPQNPDPMPNNTHVIYIAEDSDAEELLANEPECGYDALKEESFLERIQNLPKSSLENDLKMSSLTYDAYQNDRFWRSDEKHILLEGGSSFTQEQITPRNA